MSTRWSTSRCEERARCLLQVGNDHMREAASGCLFLLRRATGPGTVGAPWRLLMPRPHGPGSGRAVGAAHGVQAAGIRLVAPKEVGPPRPSRRVPSPVRWAWAARAVGPSQGDRPTQRSRVRGRVAGWKGILDVSPTSCAAASVRGPQIPPARSFEVLSPGAASHTPSVRRQAARSSAGSR